MTRRRKAREAALEVLYRYDLVKDDDERTIPEVIVRLSLGPETAEYFTRLVKTTLKYLNKIDTLIQKHLKRWRLDRLTTVDRVIIRLAACEILYFSDIPPKVSINEAVEIAKKYSDDKSGKFVNGVLDAIYKSLKQDENYQSETKSI